MSARAGPPRSHSQPSRKGKKAWRKNVDLTNVESGIDAARDEAIITGGKVFADVPSDALFQTDTAGSAVIQREARRKHPPLKADEIIAQRSAVPAVSSRKRPGDQVRVTDGVIEPRSKRKKSNGVSHKELERLKQIAYSGAAAREDVIEHTDSATHDPWEAKAEQPVEPLQSFLDRPQPIKAPKTLKYAPVSLTANGKSIPSVRKPNAGRSYNPAFEDWSALLEKEGEKAVDAEKKRLREAEAERLREERAAEVARRIEAAEKEDELLSEYESEWEGIQSELDEVQLSKKRPERKTPAERNKVKRRKKAEQQERHEKRTKERDQQAKRIVELQKAVDAHHAERQQYALQKPDVESDSDASADERLRRRRFGKHAVPQAPLELVLPDELQDSLRRLKPEGNLLGDRFRNMLIQGKVEARRPITQPKKVKKKMTEKWSYKDWKLPGTVA